MKKNRREHEAATVIFGPPVGGEADAGVGRRWLDLRAGQMVGGCEVVRLAGRGGMSHVHQVRRRDWGLDMALKLPAADALDRLTAGALLREAEAWLLPARHPNTVTCHYVLRLMGHPAIFLEYVEGRSVAALMEEGRGPLYAGGREGAPLKILDILIQAARGLGYIHSLGLCRLDIKPANLLLEEGGRLLLADFAPLAAGLGTPQYFSPETAESGLGDVFADLWALALSGLECFLGRRPWATGSVAGYALDSYAGEPWAAPPPPGLMDFFRRALAPEISARHQSAAEVEAALQALYRGLAGREYPRPAPVPLPENAARLRNKAASFLELGLPERAARLWREAPALSPGPALARVAPVQWPGYGRG